MSDEVTSPVIVDGRIALSRIIALDETVSVEGHIYNFIGLNGVSLCWVKLEHADAVLAIRKICCGGTPSRVFTYANSAQVAYWQSKGGK